MIDITKLTKDDIGKWVRYFDGFAGQFGRVKGWNRELIFVVYHCNGEWDDINNYTGEGARPEQLSFLSEYDTVQVRIQVKLLNGIKVKED